MAMDDSTIMDMRVVSGVLRAVEVPRPKIRPEDCGFSNEDLECLGCGEKLGCIVPGRCWAVEGNSVLKARVCT